MPHYRKGSARGSHRINTDMYFVSHLLSAVGAASSRSSIVAPAFFAADCRPRLARALSARACRLRSFRSTRALSSAACCLGSSLPSRDGFSLLRLALRCFARRSCFTAGSRSSSNRTCSTAYLRCSCGCSCSIAQSELQSRRSGGSASSKALGDVLERGDVQPADVEQHRIHRLHRR